MDAHHPSAYHRMLDIARRVCFAEVSHVFIENTDLLRDLILGGAILFEQRPPSTSSGATLARAAEDGETLLCECAPDEALGMALACGGRVLVEREVWLQAQLKPRYNMQRGPLPAVLETQ